MYDVFISYSSKDKDIAYKIVDFLENNNIKCWIAYRDAEAGNAYAASIIDAIKASKIFLLVFSKNSNGSKHVLREIDLACKYERFMIPFKVCDVLPDGAVEYYLSSTHWLNAFEGSVEKYFNSLKQLAKKYLDQMVKIETAQGYILEEIISEEENQFTILLKKTKKEIAEQNFIEAEKTCCKLAEIDIKNAELWICRLLIEAKVGNLQKLSLTKQNYTRSSNYLKAMQYGNEMQKTESKNAVESARKNLLDEQIKQRLASQKTISAEIRQIEKQEAEWRLSEIKAKTERLRLERLERESREQKEAENTHKSVGEPFSVADENDLSADITKSMSQQFSLSVSKISQPINTNPSAVFVNVSVGDKVQFGLYPQTADGYDFTPIEWRILARSDNEILVISEKLIDSLPYNEDGKEVHWVDSDIRKWLNNDFYNSAFNVYEKSAIKKSCCTGNGAYVVVDYEKNEYDYKEVGCGDTEDHVFLLNVQETRMYFIDESNIGLLFNEKRVAQQTEYAAKKDLALLNGETANKKKSSKQKSFVGRDSEWWLRNRGLGGMSFAAYVDSTGSVRSHGAKTHGSLGGITHGIRPAVRIKL